MARSAALNARRALVNLLQRLARKYAVVLALFHRSSDLEVQGAFRRVVRRARPDKGGAHADVQQLRAPQTLLESVGWTQRRDKSSSETRFRFPVPPGAAKTLL